MGDILTKREQAEQRLYEFIKDLPERVKFQVNLDIAITYFRRSRTGGRALGASQIELNEDLLEREPTEMLEQTLPHELAHCLTAATSPGAKPHGPEWQYFMGVLGVEATRCHDMDVSDVPIKYHRRPHLYECGCMIHRVTTTKHNKMLFKGRTRRCTRCGNDLIFKESQHG